MENRCRKGQVALEAVIIIGFVFLLMLPLLYVLFSRMISIQDEFRTMEVTRAIDTLASTVSTVGVIGPNGTASVDITLPDNVMQLSIGSTNPREIVAVVSTSLGNIDIVRVVPYAVTGSINSTQGTYRLRVTYYEGGLPIEVKKG
ncbi:Uncharacterised protein [uncultured archaeon]|nr:Uncharacterised protein [uncultured archaeon]